MMKVWLSAACVLLLAIPAQAKKQGSVDYLSLAAMLARDGNYERADIALKQVDTSQDDFDAPRFHLIRGIIRLNMGIYRQAAEDFQVSVDLSLKRHQEDETLPGPQPMVFVYLGQALFLSQDYAGALLAMQKAGAKADEIPSTFALRAECLWKLGRRPEAWEMLNRGMAMHPQHTDLLRRKLYYAIDLGLYKVAVDLGGDYLQKTDAGYKDHLALAQALFRSGSEKEALKFFELARLRAPTQAAPGMALARAYAKRGDYHSAASIMERVALMGEAEAFVEAAELYRLAGSNMQAISLNRYVADSGKRLRQRLAIALDMGNYPLVASLERDLTRTGLIRDDENIRYALAYALFKEGEFERSRWLLSALRAPELFRKGTALREAMNRCADSPWSCW